MHQAPSQARGLLAHVLERHDFFKRAKVGKGLIHPLLQMSAGLALHNLRRENDNRLLLILPRRWECARWIAVLCALDVMREDYRRVVSNINFTPGQKLLLNGNCVVEFLEFDEAGGFLWIRPGDDGRESNIRHRLPLSRDLQLQPVPETRRLTPYRKTAARVHHCAEETALDTLLRVRSRGNLSLFEQSVALVSEIGRTRRFAEDNSVAEEKLSALLRWGKLSDEGRAQALHYETSATSPTCCVAASLHGAAAWREDNPQSCRVVIVDGASRVAPHLGVLDDRLLDTNVPVIVIADERDNESLEIWRERDFRIWRWHENNAPREKEFGEIFNDAPFAPLRRAVAQMHDNEIKIARCESPPLEELAALLFRFDRALNDENPDLQSALGGAYGVLLSLSRLLHEPAEMETGNLENKVARLCAVFEAPELWLSAEARELANQIAARLRELPAQLRAGGVLTKPQLLGELLDNSEGEIAIVLPGRDEASAARAWWKTRLPSSSWTRIHFASAADWMEDYENGAEGGIAHFIVGGWLGKQRMFDLLHARFSPRVSLLLHPFEERWYGFARRRWDAGSTHSEKESAAHWSDWLGLPRGSLHLNSAPTIEENETTAANEESTPDLSSAASETDWFDYELRLNNYKYAGGQSRVGSRAEQIPSRLVVLGSGRWAFVTEFRRLWTLTDWMREENTDAAMKIPRRRIADLHVGDWVLFRTSERDLIREAADRILKKQAQHEARYLAGLWNAKLAEKYAALNFDLHALCRGLHNAGCKRTSQTIRNWIKDDETIGPTDPDDLLRIAIATGDDELTRRFDDVQQAITIVRGAHLSAADAIEKQLHSVLPRLVAARRDENSGALLEFSLPHLGAVVIAQIEEIGPVSQECRLSQCNRLMSEE